MVAAAFAATILCASCSSAPNEAAPSKGPQAMTAAQLATEYRIEEKTLTLAPNVTWPADPTPPSVASDGRSQLYERGYGTTRADHYWYCSWLQHYIDPAISGKDRKTAYAALLTVHNTEYYKVAILPEDKVPFDKELNDAGLGDNTEMQNDVLQNCGK
jgi:hypothetical protein